MTDIDDIRKKMKTASNDDIKKVEHIEKDNSKKEEPADANVHSFDFAKGQTSQEELKKDNDIIKKVLKGQKIKRKEKKFIENKEFEGTKLRNNLILAFAVIGLFFILFLYLYMHVDWMFIIIMLLGSMMFLPVGMILGWAVLDPYVRCKIFRKLTRKNYGIINFVGKGQKLISKVKNFEQALVWKKNEVWIISEEFIYQLSKDGDSIVEKGKIKPECIVTLIDTVPVVFVDVDSMQPLTLARDRREGVNPLELGATLKAWVDNQLAKAMFLKSTYNIYFVIIIGCAIGAILFGYINYTKLEEITETLKTMSTQIQSLLAMPPK